MAKRKKTTRKGPGSRTPQDRPGRYDFFLNPYNDMGFTRCPKCERKTKVRKFPLVIHIEPQTLFILNKTCRFCPQCELIIGHQREIEPMIAATCTTQAPAMVGNDYLVIGTLDRADWRAGERGDLSQLGTVEALVPFRGHVNFEIRGGWELDERPSAAGCGAPSVTTAGRRGARPSKRRSSASRPISRCSPSAMRTTGAAVLGAMLYRGSKSATVGVSSASNRSAIRPGVVVSR